MTTWFLSDIHLKHENERNGNLLLRFLFYLNQNPKEHRLFLVGDIFDAWVSDGSAFVKQFPRVIDQISRLKKNGGEVYYFEGNHDVHIDIFWTRKFHIPVIENYDYFDIAGMNVRVEHGDFINPDDKAYLQWRELSRKPWMELLGHKLPSHFWKWLTERHSAKSRKKSSRYAQENSEKIRQLIRRYAEKTYQEKAFDLIVTGHMHIFDEYEFQIGNKKIKSVNLGTWLESPRALRIQDGKLEVVSVTDYTADAR